MNGREMAERLCREHERRQSRLRRVQRRNMGVGWKEIAAILLGVGVALVACWLGMYLTRGVK